MQYSFSYFKNNMPAWKRKKDPVLSKIFYRPISFFTASICAKMGIMANTVSYISIIVAIAACALFVVPGNYYAHIAGAILINIWLIMDCTDGNLARGVKKQPFGEFADGVSSYILVGLMCIAMSMAVFFSGGAVFAKGNPWIILLGALASISDTMMRLIYQKYTNVKRDMEDKLIIPSEKDEHKNVANVGSLKSRLENELGVGGILPIFIMLATIFDFLDVVVLYCTVYYGGACVVSSISFIRKAIIYTVQYQDKMLQ